VTDSAITNSLRAVAAEPVDGGYGSLAPVIERRITEARRDLAIFEQPLTPGSESPGQSVASVRLSAAPGPSGMRYAFVENVSTKPIEAIGIRYADGGIRSDYCEALDSRSGSGPILPGETREVSVSHAADLSLSLVLYSDLTFEGQADERNQLLRSRERRAATKAFEIAALSEAAQQPPEQVIPFLEGKKREYAISMAATREGPDHTADVDQVIERAKKAPNEVMALATQLVQVLKRQQAQLTRHQAR
jgi:hypothetical protein